MNLWEVLSLVLLSGITCCCISLAGTGLLKVVGADVRVNPLLQAFHGYWIGTLLFISIAAICFTCGKTIFTAGILLLVAVLYQARHLKSSHQQQANRYYLLRIAGYIAGAFLIALIISVTPLLDFGGRSVLPSHADVQIYGQVTQLLSSGYESVHFNLRVAGVQEIPRAAYHYPELYLNAVFSRLSGAPATITYLLCVIPYFFGGFILGTLAIANAYGLRKRSQPLALVMIYTGVKIFTLATVGKAVLHWAFHPVQLLKIAIIQTVLYACFIYYRKKCNISVWTLWLLPVINAGLLPSVIAATVLLIMLRIIDNRERDLGSITAELILPGIIYCIGYWLIYANGTGDGSAYPLFFVGFNNQLFFPAAKAVITILVYLLVWVVPVVAITGIGEWKKHILAARILLAFFMGGAIAYGALYYVWDSNQLMYLGLIPGMNVLCIAFLSARFDQLINKSLQANLALGFLFIIAISNTWLLTRDYNHYLVNRERAFSALFSAQLYKAMRDSDQPLTIGYIRSSGEYGSAQLDYHTYFNPPAAFIDDQFNGVYHLCLSDSIAAANALTFEPIAEIAKSKLSIAQRGVFYRIIYGAPPEPYASISRNERYRLLVRKSNMKLLMAAPGSKIPACVDTAGIELLAIDHATGWHLYRQHIY